MFADAKPLASWADGFEEDRRSTRQRSAAATSERVHESYFKRRFGSPLDFILGPGPRVVLGGGVARAASDCGCGRTAA